MATVRALPARATRDRRRPPQGIDSGSLYVVALILLLFALTFTFPVPLRPAEVSPTFWPRLLLLLLLATVIVDRLATAWVAHDGSLAPAAPRLVGKGPALAGIAFAAYWLGLHFFGFHIATPLFVAAAAPIFGLKRPWPIAGLALVATLTIGVAFVGLLYLPLPRGEIELFHQLNAGIDGHLSTLRP